jgi:hypothetical protein
LLSSAFADTVNITGGTIKGNIVGLGSNDTVNFALGAGNTFTYAAPFGFMGMAQANIISGTVLLNGDNSASLVDVRSGGTLGGTGTVTGAVTVDPGGTFSPDARGARHLYDDYRPSHLRAGLDLQRVSQSWGHELQSFGPGLQSCEHDPCHRDRHRDAHRRHGRPPLPGRRLRVPHDLHHFECDDPHRRVQRAGHH